GFPAITVPMGFTYGSLPAGLTLLGRSFSEPDLIKFVYSYEQATKHRRPPEKIPPLTPGAGTNSAIQHKRSNQTGMRQIILSFGLFLVRRLGSLAQSSVQTGSKSINDQVDALFKRWNKSDSPGCVLGVVRVP